MYQKVKIPTANCGAFMGFLLVKIGQPILITHEFHGWNFRA